MFYTLTACIVLDVPSMPVSVLPVVGYITCLLPRLSRGGPQRHTKLAMYDMAGVAIERYHCEC